MTGVTGGWVIGVKVGLAAGPVRWVIPGHGERYVFYFRGPAASRTTISAP